MAASDPTSFLMSNGFDDTIQHGCDGGTIRRDKLRCECDVFQVQVSGFRGNFSKIGPDLLVV